LFFSFHFYILGALDMRESSSLTRSLAAMAIAIAIAIANLLGAAPAQATGVYDLPVINAGESTWVLDPAEVLSLSTETSLGGKLKKLAQESGMEVRAIAIRRLDYEDTIDTLADKIFAAWYPTAEEKSNQTLLVMDTLTNTTAMRVGDGVKKLLPEETITSIVEETIGVPLRNGNKYNQAFSDASVRLVAILSGDADPGPPMVKDTIDIEGTFTKAEDTNAGSATIWVIVLLIVATVVPMVTYFWYVGFPNN
jgi:uncharacterized protein